VLWGGALPPGSGGEHTMVERGCGWSPYLVFEVGGGLRTVLAQSMVVWAYYG
jgi:hypothetical protein